jgi:hypothetical protein
VIAGTNPAKSLLAIGDVLILVQDLEVQNATVVEMEILEAQDTLNHTAQTDQAVIIAEIDGDPVQIYLTVIPPDIVRTQKSVRLIKLSEVFP